MNAIRDAYPSRGHRSWRFVDRVDPVVWSSNAAGPLTPDLLSRFERDGFLVLEGLLGSEVDRIRARVRALEARSRDGSLPDEHTFFEPGADDAVRSIFSFHRHDDSLRALCADRRLAGAARQILGSDVYLHQSRINFKPGFEGKPFYWHSDFETWHSEDGMPAMRAVSCAVALTDNDEYNGPLMLLPGSHEVFVTCPGETPKNHYRQSLREQRVGVPPEAALSVMVGRYGIESFTGPAGSVVFFDCNTMHGSGGNITPNPRHNLFFVYNSVENRLVAPFCGRPPRPEHIAARENTRGLLQH